MSVALRPLRTRGAAAAAGQVLACVLVGAIVARGDVRLALAALVGVAAFAVGIHSWRLSIYGVLLYLPLSGIPVILTYGGNQTPALLAKDVLFVLPAYVGFALGRLRSTWRDEARPGLPPGTVLLGLFVLIVLGQTVVAARTNLLIALIGAKVWIGYVPLYYLGYRLVRDRADLDRLLRLFAIAAVIPVAVGLLEAVLVYGGDSGLVYGAYGPAAAAVTQGFQGFMYQGGGTLRRLPSTFSFVTQYYIFLSAMVAVVYGWWRGTADGRRVRARGPLLWGAVVCAAFLSGARGAFVFVPLLVVLIAVLEGRRLSLPRLAFPIGIFLAAVALVGVAGGAVLASTVHLGVAEFKDAFYSGFAHAWSFTKLGLGVGVDTNATRYALAQQSLFAGVAGRWYESWWVKVQLELGVEGLLVLGALAVSFLVVALRRHRRVRDPRLRTVSACLIVFVLWALVYGFKAQYVDLDPVNVYLWLLAGVLVRTWELGDA